MILGLTNCIKLKFSDQLPSNAVFSGKYPDFETENVPRGDSHMLFPIIQSFDKFLPTISVCFFVTETSIES